MADGECHPEDDRLAELLAGYDEALAACQAPETSPGADERLEEDFACLRLLDRLRAWPATTPRAALPQAPAESGELRYELHRLHASGGIGRVWQAWDAELGREVALKELRPERTADPALAERFLNEARITGRLQHPGIVPVYEMVPGDEGGPAFYTMRLVRGRTLTDAVREYHGGLANGRRVPLDLIRLLNAFISVCNTVAYAHTQGVVHRDLKGENVVLGDFGEVVVLDWGFAKERPTAQMPELADPPGGTRELTDRANQTQAGQLLGTPAYMAPEQAEGRLDEIDVRTDVFGLGACLYEILTGGPPFVGVDTTEVLRKARAGNPPPPRLVRTHVPAALSAVCARAMARRPADRYRSAADLAREVQHWLADEPTEAYPERLGGRASRWARHHKSALAVLAATSITAALAIGVGLALIGESRSQAVRAEAKAQAERAEARAEADAAIQRRLEGQLYLQRVALAEREQAAGNLGRAAELLAACPRPLRGWEWHYLKRRCLTEQVVLRGHAGAVAAVALSPDGQILASGAHDHCVKLWDPATGRHLADIRGHTDVVYDVAFSPDGRLLASASWDRTVNIWDVRTRRKLRTLTDHRTNVYRVAFRPDGKVLASVSSDQRVVLSDVSSGRQVGSWEMPVGFQVWRPAFTPDGSALALTTTRGIVFLDTRAPGNLVRELPVDSSFVKCIAFSSDGQTMATGEGDLAAGDSGRIRIWDVASGERLFALEGHSEPVFALAFSPDGSRLFSASQDRTVKIWNLGTREETVTLRGHQDTVRGLALGEGGNLLVTASSDGTVRLWDATPVGASEPGELHALSGHTEPVFSLAFGLGGQRAYSLDIGATIRGWDIERGVETSVCTLPRDRRAFSLGASPDGRLLAVGATTGKIYLIDPLVGQVAQVIDGHEPGPIKGIAFSSDGKYLASAGWDRTVRLTPRFEGEPRVLRGHCESVLDVAFTPDSRRLASASYDGTVRIWDVRTGACLRTLDCRTGRVRCVAYSRSGELLAAAGHDGTVRVWETADWKPRRSLSGHTAEVDGVAFSPDDRHLASASQDRTVKVWSLKTGAVVRTYHGHTGRVHAVAFSPDGRRLVSAGQDNAVRVWAFDLLARPD